MATNIRLKIGILSIFLTPILVGSGLSPILLDLSTFIGSQQNAKLFLTLPSLIIIPFLFLSSMLSGYFNKRSLVMVGLLLYIISGIGGALSFNVELFMIFRILCGIGAGLVIPYSNSLFSDYFVSNERIQMISISGVLTFIGGIVIFLLAGIFSKIHWRLSFVVFFIAAVPLWFIYKYIPSSKNYIHHYPIVFSYMLKKQTWLLSFFYFICMLFTFVYFTNISFLISSNNLGNQMISSYAQSLYMLFGILSNFLMFYIKKISSYWLYFIQILCMSIAFLLLGFLNNYLIFIYMGSIILGLGFGSLGNNIISDISNMSSKTNKIGSLAVFFALMYLAQFLSPLFFNQIFVIFNRPYDQNLIFIISGIIFLIFSAIMIFRKMFFIIIIKNSKGISL